jgi:hypothetical protein
VNPCDCTRSEMNHRPRVVSTGKRNLDRAASAYNDD